MEEHHLLLKDQINGAENGETESRVLIILNGCYYNDAVFWKHDHLHLGQDQNTKFLINQKKQSKAN